jgi:hypothetical protein
VNRAFGTSCVRVLTSSSFAISRGALLTEKQLHDLLRPPTVDCAIEGRAHADEQVCSIVFGMPHHRLRCRRITRRTGELHAVLVLPTMIHRIGSSWLLLRRCWRVDDMMGSCVNIYNIKAHVRLSLSIESLVFFSYNNLVNNTF